MNALTASLLTLFGAFSMLGAIAIAMIALPVLNHDIKRTLRIPTESSGPHYADGTTADIPGSADFLFCALGHTGASATCEVTRTKGGWRITSAATSDPHDCAAMCLK